MFDVQVDHCACLQQTQPASYIREPRLSLHHCLIARDVFTKKSSSFLQLSSTPASSLIQIMCIPISNSICLTVSQTPSLPPSLPPHPPLFLSRHQLTCRQTLWCCWLSGCCFQSAPAVDEKALSHPLSETLMLHPNTKLGDLEWSLQLSPIIWLSHWQNNQQGLNIV